MQAEDSPTVVRRGTRGKLSPSQRGLIALLSLLAVWPAWLRAGTPAYTQYPLPWIALAALLVAWCAPRRHRADPGGGIRRAARDPVLYLALAFLGLLALQWWNAGRVLFFDPLDHAWVYSAPARPGWPAAFTRPEALEMLRWFFPAACAVLALRAGVLGPGGVRTLWRALTLSAALLALAGLVQQAIGVHFLPYTRELDIRIFASFGYENHAASYFALATALSAALLVRDAFTRGGPRRGARLVLGGAVLALTFTATQLSLSRAGILLGWLFLLGGGTWGLVRTWPLLSPSRRVNLVSGVAAFVLALVMLGLAYGGDRIVHELATLQHPETASVVEGFGQAVEASRSRLIGAAFEIWREAPWFGVGGWGYRYLLPYTQPEDDWQWTQGFGRANVHNDPVQFLVEFGVVGSLLLAAVLVLLVVPLLRRDPWGSRPVADKPAAFFALLGTGLVLLHSLIDLPFRSPAILLLFVIALAGASRASVKR